MLTMQKVLLNNNLAQQSRKLSCKAVAAPKGSQSSQKYGRIFNFSAGPATLPIDVLEQVQTDLFSWRGSGLSVMEMSHRGKEFTQIIQEAEQDLRELMNISDDYEVLFLQGGASTLFSAVPLNLSSESDLIDYVVTGSWSKKAIKEATRMNPTGASATLTTDFKSTPEIITPRENSKFVYYCDNETIEGVEFKGTPKLADPTATLVSDMSSSFISKPVNVSDHGCIFAGAQKNVGPAGVTIAIIRKDLVGSAREGTPVMLDFKTHADTGSLYNTPPAFSIYVCGLTFKKLLREGGLSAQEARNNDKCAVVYNAIDKSGGFYACPVEKSARSRMNVPFTIPNKPELEKVFVQEASDAGLKELKGHRSVGGMRASIYNAMPMEGVEELAKFMKAFSNKHAQGVFH